MCSILAADQLRRDISASDEALKMLHAKLIGAVKADQVGVARASQNLPIAVSACCVIFLPGGPGSFATQAQESRHRKYGEILSSAYRERKRLDFTFGFITLCAQVLMFENRKLRREAQEVTAALETEQKLSCSLNERVGELQAEKKKLSGALAGSLSIPLNFHILIGYPR